MGLNSEYLEKIKTSNADAIKLPVPIILMAVKDSKPLIFRLVFSHVNQAEIIVQPFYKMVSSSYVIK